VWILYQYLVAVLYTMDSEVGLSGPSQKSHQPIFKDKSNKLVPWLVFSKDIRKIIAIRFMSENRREDILAGPKEWRLALGGRIRDTILILILSDIKIILNYRFL
jgi:hypothetical protein